MSPPEADKHFKEAGQFIRPLADTAIGVRFISEIGSNYKKGDITMTKFEKRLCVFAIVFVAVYIGAIVLTLHTRVRNENRITRIESVEPLPGEGQVMLAELLLPMLILLTVTVCFIIVRKRRAESVLGLKDSDEEFH